MAHVPRCLWAPTSPLPASSPSVFISLASLPHSWTSLARFRAQWKGSKRGEITILSSPNPSGPSRTMMRATGAGRKDRWWPSIGFAAAAVAAKGAREAIGVRGRVASHLRARHCRPRANPGWIAGSTESTCKVRVSAFHFSTSPLVPAPASHIRPPLPSRKELRKREE